jgi:hypothetical protein
MTDTCEHGMAAWLCAGPGHYPADDDAPFATMADAAAEYHRQGLSCPFDCIQCDPYYLTDPNEA